MILEANFCSAACVPSFPRTQVSLVEAAWVELKFSASLFPFRQLPYTQGHSPLGLVSSGP